MVWYKSITLPNLLTLVRMIVSPVVLPFLFVYLLPLNIFWVNFLLTLIFLLFGLTDFFDGYFARKWGQVTSLGSLLDPIADKFLLCAVLISLLAAHKIYFYWVIILIGREFFVMGLRLIAAEQKISIPVSFLAKIKTCIEIFYIAFVIINASNLDNSFFNRWHVTQIILWWLTMSLSLWTAYKYYKEFIAKIAVHEDVSL